MNTTAKKLLNIALKVVTWLLVAFTVFMMIFTVVTVTTVDKNDRDIFGIKFYIVRTNSMSKSDKNADMDVHFNAGDIVIIKNVDDPTKLQPGDIIAFMSTNSENYGETVTHMIREVKKTDDGRLRGYVTFGTNKGVDDEALVGPEYVLGAYSGKLPGVGNFFAFVKSTPGYIVCILVPFLLLILYNGINVIRLFRKYKREQMEAMQAEKDKLEAERAENQRMMQELLALKAQLEQKSGEGTPTAEPASEAATEENATTDETEETKSEDAESEKITDEA
jgi:signal peptidase I